jgi:hypothetical protein
MRFILPIVGVCLALALIGAACARSSGSAASKPGAIPAAAMLPDLRVLPAEDLQFDTIEIDGESHHVIRFATTTLNLGVGPVHLVGEHDPKLDKTVVTQSLFDKAGDEVATRHVGEFVFHEGHNHWHMEHFVRHELFQAEEEQITGKVELAETDKISFCVRDMRQIAPIDGSPDSARYNTCGHYIQGLSIGWGDVYSASLQDQWVVLGPANGGPPLADGEYAVVLTVDPLNNIYESDAGNNSSTTYFRVEGGEIVDDEDDSLAVRQ